MFYPNFKTLCAAAFVALGGLAFASTAQAAPVPFDSCSDAGPPAYDISGKIDGAYDCRIYTGIDQDFIGGAPATWTVNLEDGFYDRTDWMLITKDDDIEDDEGSFDISSFSPTGTIMAVFKAGSGASGVSLVAYLIDSLSGDWDSPFLDPPFDFPGASTEKDVSHITFYKSLTEVPGCDPLTEICGPGVGVVPVPAGLPLLLTGLGVVGVMSRRRRS